MMQAFLTKTRQDLHQIPELGLQEHKTADYIEQALNNMGKFEIKRHLDTAVLAFLAGEDTSKTLAFRADIDALPVTEQTGCAFASLHEGHMHACGHDGHTAALLGFAKQLAEQSARPSKNILLIFQPAEEGPGGAQLLMDEGIFAHYHVEKIVGAHIFPQIEQGKIGCKSGALMARNGEVTIRVFGQSAHGAQPELGADAVLAASAIVTGLHSIVSRNLSPLSSGVLTLGQIMGGEARNVIAKEVSVLGTLRAFSDEAYETIVSRTQTLATQIAEGYGCRAEVSFFHMYRVVDNDAKMVQTLKEVCGEAYVESPAYMLAEDFSMYQQHVPGVFFFVGSKNEDKGFVHPLHHAQFNFDEAILAQCVEVYAKLAEQL